MKRLLAPAVLAVAFSASLPAQNTGTVGTPASFKDEAKAELVVELIKKYEGLHDRSDYPYYGYGHCKLPGEELSYDMTEAEAEKLLIRDLEKRYRLFSKYGKDALILSEISDNKRESFAQSAIQAISLTERSLVVRMHILGIELHLHPLGQFR